MRLRKENGVWNQGMFWKAFIPAGLAYTAILLLDYWGDKKIALSAWINLAFYPLMFGSVFAHSSRSSRLYVSDYQAVADFKSLLLEKLKKEGYQLIDNSRETVAYRLKKTVWRWFDAGQICITWGDEVVIAGPVNRVSPVFRKLAP